MQQQTAGFISIDGVNLEYRWFGPAAEQAPTLVLLHEGVGCAELWKAFPQRLAQASGCGVLVYSRQGYGGSDPVSLPRPLTYMHDEGLNTLPQVLDAADIRQAVLVGHSDGASIALIHAGGRQDPRIKGVVLMAPHVFAEELSITSIRGAKQAYEQGDLRRRLQRYHGANVDCAFWGWNRAWLDPGFLDWNLEAFLPGIRVPVLMIQGRDDEYGTVEQLKAIQRQVDAEAQVVLLDDCGHSPQRDQPDATLNAIVGFAARVIDPPGKRYPGVNDPMECAWPKNDPAERDPINHQDSDIKHHDACGAVTRRGQCSNHH